jgi:hypothetical protein
LVAALNRIEGQLNRDAYPAPATEARNGAKGPSGRSAAAAAEVHSAGPTLVATATGTMLHRADCSVVANKEGLLTLPADAAGYKACRLCEPLTIS